MILCSKTATCLTYFDCMDHKNAAWGVDNARSNSHLYQDLKYTIRTSQNVIKYTSTKLYNPDIYNKSMFIEHVTNL